MSEFIRERIKIEEEYAKNLAKLSQNSRAAQEEEGSLGEAWALVKKSLADEADVHLKFSAKLHSEVEKPLMNFHENFKKDMKKCDHHIADLRKQLASRYASVEKAWKALTERQRDLEMKTQQLEIRLSNKTEEDIKNGGRMPVFGTNLQACWGGLITAALGPPDGCPRGCGMTPDSRPGVCGWLGTRVRLIRAANSMRPWASQTTSLPPLLL
ncbi:Growth arrest-specific protein 7 [Sciurus carolinensis]|uniref:Growth arrest-specific protein 7 n=1 Tax=Sciurus carolinensis TaxID=30640 RepID=A0AA41N8M1_SCICA|nr:Growth arrest-specific protein 7 [Sciurus carolinensis]